MLNLWPPLFLEPNEILPVDESSFESSAELKCESMIPLPIGAATAVSFSTEVNRPVLPHGQVHEDSSGAA